MKFNKNLSKTTNDFVQESSYIFQGKGVKAFNDPGLVPPKKRRGKKRGKPIKTTENDPDGLTKKERAFLNEYVKDYNGTQAIYRSKCCKATSDGSAASAASQILNNIKVLQAITKYEKDLSTRFIDEKGKLLKEMSLLANSDISDYITPDGELRVKNFKDLPPQVSKAIKSVTVHTKSRKLFKASSEGEKGDEIIEQHVTFSLYDKIQALIKMGQHVGIFKEKKELTGPNDEPLIPQGSTTVLFDFGAE